LRTIESARSELLASRATFANTIIRSHSFSWTRLFNELEKVMPLGARVVNIRPRMDDSILIRINGVARNAQSFWELQDNLEAWPVFGNIYPDSVQPTASRAGIMTGELLFSLEMEYFPSARLLLGLPENEPGLVDAAGVPPTRAAGQETRDEEQTTSAEGETLAPDSQAATAADAVPARGSAPGAEKLSSKGRGGRRRQGNASQTAGVQQRSKVAEGAPGLEEPDMGDVQRAEFPSGAAVPQVILAGRNAAGEPIDENGNVISIEDVLNRPGGIQPGPPLVDGSAPDPEGVEDSAANADAKAAPRRDPREKKQ
jgi:hypothetical protein